MDMNLYLQKIKDKCDASVEKAYTSNPLVMLKTDTIYWLLDQSEENEKRKGIIQANYHEYSELEKKRRKLLEENEFLKDDVHVRNERVDELEKELQELKRAASKS
jgi:predicted RNase H-like nuclease (RuvC/YqgF family)